MAETGAGSGRIVLVRRTRERTVARERPAVPEPGAVQERPAAGVRAPLPSRPAVPKPPRTRRAERAVTAAPEPRDDADASGWTVRQLVNGASLGGIATVAGGLLFQRNFEFLGDNNAPVLAMGFGLFVVGMIVFTSCLIGLAGAAFRALLDGPGRAAAAAAALAPMAVLALLVAVGVVPPAFLALLAIVAIGGLALALRR